MSSRASLAHTAFENNDPPSSRTAHEGASSEPGHELDSALSVAGMWGVIEGSSSSVALLAALYCAGAPGPLAARVAAVASVGGAAASAARGWARCALEHATYRRERAREEWELAHYEEGERKEVVDLWVSRGVSRAHAETATAALAGYKDVFVDIMMDQEVLLHAVRLRSRGGGRRPTARARTSHVQPSNIPRPSLAAPVHPSRGWRDSLLILSLIIHSAAAAPMGRCGCWEAQFR